ncbi:MAG TPA: NUDIX hydrolase [Solirubrobacterales bacterium]|jgi:8-oxo-dGTP pyrophosphatase MutT (NUDIX family)
MAEEERREEERRLGPAEMPNFGPPSEPRQAASIVLLRRGGKHGQRALEVLLLKRSAEARFMPSVWVFPGGSVDQADGEGEAGARACAVRELQEEAGIELPPEEELVLFSRWITPEVVATRFDARFYLALAPAHAPPEADGVETVEARWFEPAAAVEAADRGEIILAFPTLTQLGLLAEHRTSQAVIAAYREGTVEPILPKVVGTREDARLLLPDDPDYPR